ncbi:hypothetical protein [Actinoplanes sp. M2I2]|uniref:hypothetical protein n=1 Tax=Actinoplanes sp. M2I2 TaxID=1734444 RepID=UPI0020213F1F|nr:hypothetical protein [Actinoplanes sp. M2I2]
MTPEEQHADAVAAAHEWRDSQRDPYGANQMDAEQLIELRAKLVAAAVAEGRRCEICGETPTAIVLNYEVEHLLCAAHAEKAQSLHEAQVEFWGAEPETRRIIRWSLERQSGYARSRQQHLR